MAASGTNVKMCLRSLMVLIAFIAIIDANEHMGLPTNCRDEIPLHLLKKRISITHPSSILTVLERHDQKKNHSCPAWSPELLASSHIEDRSFSPWSYRINEDPKRIPATIPEAVCLCRGCISFSKMKHTLDYISVPVTTTMQVYYHTSCGGHKFQYETKWIEIAVACTCIAPKMGLTYS
ncbi:interleukin-17C-like [Chiloscyllium plagiosum]|uniref:interleukin-17C-like n=1 Tax=Chiloscyllium plagiosum TaxID=36176 RepID=UPI001CB80B1B|nr:interleukin-17C-like [Chiloscyllium plagiosum]